MSTHQPEWLNSKRYVKVADLKLGKPGAYTDYEELAFMNDPTDYDWLTKMKDIIKSNQLTEDQSELVFYTSIHCLNSCEEVTGKVTERDVETVIDTAVFMLTEVLTSEWVLRHDAE